MYLHHLFFFFILRINAAIPRSNTTFLSVSIKHLKLPDTMYRETLQIKPKT